MVTVENVTGTLATLAGVDEEEVLAPSSAATMPEYASFFSRFSSQGNAAPVPEKVLGIQEYLSV